MPLLIALAISIGILAVLATWLVLGPLAALGFQIWQVFIAWACHYHCGGKLAGTRTTILCMSFGAIVGVLSVMLAGQLGGLGAFAAPIAVGLGAASIVLAAHIGLLSVIPASVYGFASVAGLILLKGVDPVQALLPTVGSIVLGAVFGYVSEALGGVLSQTSSAKTGVPPTPSAG
jgi:Protein of unknown function (DUF1097)